MNNVLPLHAARPSAQIFGETEPIQKREAVQDCLLCGASVSTNGLIFMAWLAASTLLCGGVGHIDCSYRALAEGHGLRPGLPMSPNTARRTADELENRGFIVRELVERDAGHVDWMNRVTRWRINLKTVVATGEQMTPSRFQSFGAKFATSPSDRLMPFQFAVRAIGRKDVGRSGRAALLLLTVSAATFGEVGIDCAGIWRLSGLSRRGWLSGLAHLENLGLISREEKGPAIVPEAIRLASRGVQELIHPCAGIDTYKDSSSKSNRLSLKQASGSADASRLEGREEREKDSAEETLRMGLSSSVKRREGSAGAFDTPYPPKPPFPLAGPDATTDRPALRLVRASPDRPDCASEGREVVSRVLSHSAPSKSQPANLKAVSLKSARWVNNRNEKTCGSLHSVLTMPSRDEEPAMPMTPRKPRQASTAEQAVANGRAKTQAVREGKSGKARLLAEWQDATARTFGREAFLSGKDKGQLTTLARLLETRFGDAATDRLVETIENWGRIRTEALAYATKVAPPAVPTPGAIYSHFDAVARWLEEGSKSVAENREAARIRQVMQDRRCTRDDAIREIARRDLLKELDQKPAVQPVQQPQTIAAPQPVRRAVVDDVADPIAGLKATTFEDLEDLFTA